MEAIAAGWNHSCAIVNGGAVCWGSNQLGQLGNNSTTDSLVPVQVTGLTASVHSIAVGDFHTCALVDHAVQCWGWNQSYQLGNNSTANSLVPVQVTGLTE